MDGTPAGHQRRNGAQEQQQQQDQEQEDRDTQRQTETDRQTDTHTHCQECKDHVDTCVKTTPQMTHFRDAKVCNNLATDKN